jgi:hypothetical protein
VQKKEDPTSPDFETFILKKEAQTSTTGSSK